MVNNFKISWSKIEIFREILLLTLVSVDLGSINLSKKSIVKSARQVLIDWTDTSFRYRHWRMCFERLRQAFARWQPGILFDIAAQPIFEYRWIDSYSQPSLRTQFKVTTVYSIPTQSRSWCSTGLAPNVLPRRDEGSDKHDLIVIVLDKSSCSPSI